MKMNKFAKLAMIGLVGVIMLVGSGVMGQKVIVTTTIPKKHTDGKIYVKVKGALGGSHACSDATYKYVGIAMTGSGAGSVKGNANTGFWYGNAGETPSATVDDTIVTISYKKTSEPIITGKALMTVIAVKGRFFGLTAFPFRLGSIWTGNADVVKDVKGIPAGLSFGDVTLSFTAPQLIAPKANPHLVQRGGNKFRFNLKVQSLILNGLLGSTVKLNCPFGPKGMKLPFSAIGIFKNGVWNAAEIE